MNTSQPKQTKSITIVSWNVNGIRSNVVSAGKYVDSLSPNSSNDSNLGEIIDRCDPDIICFQETKFDMAKPESLRQRSIDVNFPEFEKFWNASKGVGARSGSRYSGTSIWTKLKPLSVSYDLPTLSHHESEGRIIVVKFQGFILINTYVPNSGTNFEYRTTVWDEAIAEYLSILREAGENVIWTGDMNVARYEKDVFFGATASRGILSGVGKQAIAGFTKEERDGMEKILNIGYSDVFRERNPDATDMFTWWNSRVSAGHRTCRDQNKGWRLDYFIVSDWLLKNVIDARVLTFSGLRTKPRGSDHAAILMKIKISTFSI
jgi:exodeoxyribonuclease-3